MRAIAEVATAVTKGDLTRSIDVEAQGEVAALKDNINEMIRNLRETTREEHRAGLAEDQPREVHPHAAGPARPRSRSAAHDPVRAGAAGLAQHGVFYINEGAKDGEPELQLLASYAYTERKHLANRFRLGEGLVGQAALEKQRILLTDVPADYVQISSGLGEATPLNIVVLPVLFEGEVKAVIELASFHRFSEIHLAFLDQLTESIGIVLNTIAANMRTEELLKQSQSLAASCRRSRRS